ncbi:MAG TPA: hypothetical protein VIH90_03505 [Candidatus Saccharimonadales bacterium]
MPSKKRPPPKVRINHIFPGWLIIVYGTACGFLIPWTIFLGEKLPRKYVSTHWDIAWTGFDVLTCILFALTAFFAAKKSSWIAITCAMLSTVLLVDVWFDVLTSRPGIDQSAAVLEAAFIEIPLAILSMAISIRIFYSLKHREIN